MRSFSSASRTAFSLVFVYCSQTQRGNFPLHHSLSLLLPSLLLFLLTCPHQVVVGNADLRKAPHEQNGLSGSRI
jgi:hypothetical protein